MNFASDAGWIQVLGAPTTNDTGRDWRGTALRGRAARLSGQAACGGGTRLDFRQNGGCWCCRQAHRWAHGAGLALVGAAAGSSGSELCAQPQRSAAAPVRSAAGQAQLGADVVAVVLAERGKGVGRLVVNVLPRPSGQQVVGGAADRILQVMVVSGGKV